MAKIFIQKDDDGRLLTIEFRALSDSAVARKITEIQNEIRLSKNRLEKLLRQKSNLDAKICSEENDKATFAAELTVFDSENFKQWLAVQKADLEARKMEHATAYAKADIFLKEHLGDKIYAQLVETGELTFENSDNDTFKITLDGRVFRKEGDGFEPICVIRPKELPIPDTILAILTTLKEEPNRILREQRGRR